ncbi:hypothetical protein Gbfr_022_041 [Gluconobacter frateurii M-2]|nr:hypothetical protein Gbfr_022_041 [Gluconobacter frateurii M-2]
MNGIISQKERLQKKSMDRSMVSELLVEALREAEVGEIVTYADLKNLTNYDVQSAHRHLLDRARRVLLRESGYVFSTVINIGLKRASAPELTHIGVSHMKKAGRSARRGGKVMDTVDRKQLTADQALEHDATRGVLAAIATVSQTKKSPPAREPSRDPQVRV